MEDNLTEFPKSPVSSSILEAAKIGTGMIPIVGGSISETLGAVFGPQIAKRQNEWFGVLRNIIISLLQWKKEITLEKLAENETFYSTVMHASQIAVRTTQAEKLDALRNAVINSALSDAIEGDLQHLYLNIVDTLPVCEMLLFMHYFRKHHSGFGTDIRARREVETKIALEKIACLRREEYLYDYYVNDLVNRGLLEWGIEQLGSGTSPNETDIGEGFYAFIHEPIKTNE